MCCGRITQILRLFRVIPPSSFVFFDRPCVPITYQLPIRFLAFGSFYSSICFHSLFKNSLSFLGSLARQKGHTIGNFEQRILMNPNSSSLLLPCWISFLTLTLVPIIRVRRSLAMIQPQQIKTPHSTIWNRIRSPLLLDGDSNKAHIHSSSCGSSVVGGGDGRWRFSRSSGGRRRRTRRFDSGWRRRWCHCGLL